MKEDVVIYTGTHCRYCVYAKDLLNAKGIVYTEISLDNDPLLREEVMLKSQRQTIPQIFIHGQPIGGYDDLYALDCKGELDKLMSKETV